MERAQVPAVVIASAGFEDDIEASAKAFGLPGVQYVVVPQVFNNLTARQAAALVEPIAGEALKLLTAGGSVIDAASDEVSATVPIWTFAAEGGRDAHYSFNRSFSENDWGDGYPLCPPTPYLVDAMTAGIDGARDDLVCWLPPGMGAATVEKVAINAVMAGCEPGDLPVVMAGLRAVAKVAPPLNLTVLMSTSAYAPLFLVNGPIAEELDLNGGRCCLGPGKQNLVNIRIGRAITLCLKNLGRWYPGIMDLDTIGTTRKFSQLIAENSAESPWEPYHVSRGFDAQDSTVSVFWTKGEYDIAIQGHLDADQLLRAIGSNLGSYTGHGYISNFFGGLTRHEEGRLVLMPPPHAHPLADGGYTKQGAQAFLHDELQTPISKMIEPMRKLHADGKIKPEWLWLFDLSEEEARARTLHVLENPDQLWIVVAGSVRAKDLVFPTASMPVTERVSRSPTGDLPPGPASAAVGRAG